MLTSMITFKVGVEVWPGCCVCVCGIGMVHGSLVFVKDHKQNTEMYLTI